MLKIEINREDYWNLNKYVLMQKYKVTVMLCVVGLPVAMTVILLAMKLPFWYSLSVGVIGGGLIDLFSYKRLKRRIKNLPEDNKGILGVHELEVTEDAISWKNNVTASSVKWDAINSFEEDKDYFYIFLDKIMAHIIPKRIFTSQNEMNIFKDQINTYLKNNK